LKMGIIGAGAIARRGHLPVCRNLDAIEVAAIADTNVEAAKNVAKEFGIPKYFSSLEEVLQDESIEMIDICTPTQTHLDIVKHVAPRGRHIIVEKPTASNLKDTLLIQKYVKENNIKLCVIQNYRYFPSVIQTRERIKGGYIGDIVSIHSWGITNFPTHWTLNPWLYHKGGALYDFGPHIIDMTLLIKNFAPIDTVFAIGGDFTKGNMDFVNYSSILIGFEDGSTASIDISWVTGTTFKCLLDIYGTAGNLVLDVRNDVVAENHGFATPIDDTRAYLKKMFKIGTGVLNGSFFKGSNQFYKPLFLDFAAAIRGEGEIPISIEQGIQTNVVLEAVERSILCKCPIKTKDLIQEMQP
jgi:predicted dehydrogenase